MMITNEMMIEIQETAADFAADKAGRDDAITNLYRLADALRIAGVDDGTEAEAEAIKKMLLDFPEIDTLMPAFEILLGFVEKWMMEVTDAYPEVVEVMRELIVAESLAVEELG